MGKKKKVTYTYTNDADANEVRLAVVGRSACIRSCNVPDPCLCRRLLLLLLLQASALEDFLFGGGASTSKLLAGGDDSIADLIKQVSRWDQHTHTPASVPCRWCTAASWL